MEPDVVSNQPKINRNTFKIGSGDLQQQVANNTKRIRVISTMLRSNRRRSADGLSPQATNIQQSLEQLNTKQFAMIEDFFTTMPKLTHTIKVKNPKTNVESDVVLEGLAAFFS